MKTLNFLATFPDSGSPWESGKAELQGVRFQNVRGFRNHLIFYRVTEVGVYIMRVIHASRNIEKQL
jgi:toxin ParE1/3/4